jgi:hypothetical protein
MNRHPIPARPVGPTPRSASQSPACAAVAGHHIHELLQQPGVDLAALCDVGEALLGRRLREVESAKEYRSPPTLPAIA